MARSSCSQSRTGGSGTRPGSRPGGPPSPARSRSAGRGEYVLQAEIAARHLDDPPDWPALAGLYGELGRLTGSPVVELNRIVAVAESGEPGAALALLEQLELDDYHYLHATRAELLRREGRPGEARTALARALDLVHSDAERRLLQRRLAELETAVGAPLAGARPPAAGIAPAAWRFNLRQQVKEFL